MRIVVAGAAGILGTAVTGHLARAGCRVAAISRRDVMGSGALRHFACADLSDPARVAAAMGDAARWLGGLDAMIHVAGAFAWKRIEDSAAEDWTALFEANVLTTFTAVRAALPHMADGGAIVAVGAASAEPAGAGMSAYAASKSAVARMVEIACRRAQDAENPCEPGPARHHRYAAQPRRHAGRGPGRLDQPRGDRRGHPFPSPLRPRARSMAPACRSRTQPGG